VTARKVNRKPARLGEGLVLDRAHRKVWGPTCGSKEVDRGGGGAGVEAKPGDTCRREYRVRGRGRRHLAAHKILRKEHREHLEGRERTRKYLARRNQGEKGEPLSPFGGDARLRLCLLRKEEE